MVASQPHHVLEVPFQEEERKKTMKRHHPALFAVAASLALWAASPATAATLNVGLSEDTDTLDPDQGRTFGGRQMFAALCDKLFDLDETAGIVGQLVTDWTVSDDGLTITLKLRPERPLP